MFHHLPRHCYLPARSNYTCWSLLVLSWRWPTSIAEHHIWCATTKRFYSWSTQHLLWKPSFGSSLVVILTKFGVKWCQLCSEFSSPSSQWRDAGKAQDEAGGEQYSPGTMPWQVPSHQLLSKEGGHWNARGDLSSMIRQQGRSHSICREDLSSKIGGTNPEN